MRDLDSTKDLADLDQLLAQTVAAEFASALTDEEKDSLREAWAIRK